MTLEEAREEEKRLFDLIKKIDETIEKKITEDLDEYEMNTEVKKIELKPAL